MRQKAGPLMYCSMEQYIRGLFLTDFLGAIGSIDFRCVPVSVVVYTGLEVVRYQHNRRATEVPEYIDMDPVFHF